MASPKMLARREEMAGLAPRTWRINRPYTAPSAPGEYQALARQAAALGRKQRRDLRAAVTAADDQARGFQRSIPTGGPGRRRAKAQRNKAACA